MPRFETDALPVVGREGKLKGVLRRVFLQPRISFGALKQRIVVRFPILLITKIEDPAGLMFGKAWRREPLDAVPGAVFLFGFGKLDFLQIGIAKGPDHVEMDALLFGRERHLLKRRNGFGPRQVPEAAIARFSDGNHACSIREWAPAMDDKTGKNAFHRNILQYGPMTATYTPRPDLIQVTYKVQSPKLVDPEKKARDIALGQTTDTWTPTEMSGKKKLAKHTGVVLGIDEKTHIAGRPYEYHLTVGFPAANTEDDIPSLLTMIFGKISMDGMIRLESIQFPDRYLEGKGPQYGIPGIRQRVGEPDKPLVMAIFKPCVGLTPKELGDKFFELAAGGAHLVKDDEILPDLPLCPVEERLEACLSAAERAKKETGNLTLYAVNLTGPVSKIVAKARALAKKGATCFLLNVLSYGYGVLEELRDVGIPIMAHPALAGAFSGSQDTGIKYAVVLGSLMRVAGADIVLFPSSYGTVSLPFEETRSIKEALTWSMGGLPKCFPVPSAGIHPGLVPKILQDYGKEVIVNAGGGVHGHPKGARAGVKAFLQAIDWSLKRGNLGGVSQREFPELTEALRLWGKG